MKKGKIIALSLLTLGLFGAVTAGAVVLAQHNESAIAIRAEGEDPVDPVDPESNAATVVINKVAHGTVEADVMEGVEGDICTLNIKAEILYVVSSVKVNGTALVEDEDISGLYKFAMVKGENVVDVSIVVDNNLLGDLSSIYAQMRDKDWTHLFSVENVLRIVTFVLNGGILSAVICYVIRDKKLAAKVEKTTRATLSDIVPETTKNIIIQSVRDFIEPMFAQMKADNVEMMKALGVFAKVLALAQEDTPESRIAIINMLSELKISDEKTLAEVKSYIDKFFADNLKKYEDILKKIEEIGAASKEIIGEEEESSESKPEAPAEDGTSI